ncbi:MAG: hypothetical protein D6722_18880, partial [Bacteroidetes bacterium]
GGGGGAGHGNNSEGTDGGGGGGIVLIRADQFDGNGFAIRVDGEDAIDGGSDGGAGGGAGGTIALLVNSFSVNPLLLSAEGGDGASVIHLNNCEGPGGGGGGGAIWTSIALPGTCTRLLGGGSAGVAQACGNATQGATAGGAGAEATGFSPAEGITPAPCVLPVVLLHACAEAGAQGISLLWETGVELNFAQTVIERQGPLGIFQALGTVPARGSDSRYQWLDVAPLPGPNVYRLRLEDLDGQAQLSPLLEAHWAEGWTAYLPAQPWDGNRPQVLEIFGPSTAPFQLVLFDLQGRVAWQQEGQLIEGQERAMIPARQLSAGGYWLRGQVGGKLKTYRVWVR